MQTRKKEVLYNLIKQIRPYTVLSAVDMPVWTAVFGVHRGGGVIERKPDAPRVMRLGDSWTGTYDDTVLFSSDIVVPEEYIGAKSYLEFNFGGEAIVRINGSIAGAVSSGWVNRDRVFLPSPMPEDRKLHIELESAIDCGSFCDVVLAGGHDVTYSLSKARLVLLDEQADSYFTDVSIVAEAQKRITDEAIAARVYAALDDSLHSVDFDFDDAAVRASFAPAAELLWSRLAEIKYVPQGTVIMTGHSHIDVAWLWTVREVLRKCARTFSNTAALIEHCPELVFAQSQAALYDMVKQAYPEVYEQVREAVKTGRWDIVGNAWVEADTNVASGEALVRQLLYGTGFFKREFGKVSDTYWLPDCFGFTWALPQIIAKSGMKYFVTAKLAGQDTNRFPDTIFRWRGIDGSEVLAYMQRTHYGDAYDSNKIADAWASNDQKNVTDTVMGMFGYGDGGGGPTPEMVENSRRISKIPGLPASKIGHASEFFAEADSHRADLPVWDDEMYYENHRGTFTSQGFLKKANRRCELQLARAEMFSLFAGRKVQPEMERAWKLLLINQFHDILPGTSIHEVYDNTREELCQCEAAASDILFAAQKSIVASVSLERRSVVCFNLGSESYSGAVRAFLPDAALLPVDTDGQPLPYEICSSLDDEGVEISFYASDVPPLGYKAYALSEAAGEFAPLTAEPALLENEYLRVAIAPNGRLLSVYDKENGCETLAAPANVLTIYSDKAIHETAWNIEADYVKRAWPLEAESVEVSDKSCMRAAVTAVYRFNKSTFTQRIALSRGSRRLDFETEADWFETEKVLRTAFPVAVKASYATYEIAHGAICRPTHVNTSYDLAKFEMCAHKWMDLSEGGYGVSILNDCKYGCDIHGSVMSLTLLRSPCCPDMTADKGEHSFTYSFYPHSGGWQSAGTVREAFALNLPHEAFLSAAHGGTLPTALSFARADRTGIVFDAVKPAEDGSGVILRVYEAEAKRGKVTVSLAFPISSACECNLMEDGAEPMECGERSFSFFIKPHEVKTFRLNRI